MMEEQSNSQKSAFSKLAQLIAMRNKPIPKLLELSVKAHIDDIGWPNSNSFKEMASYEEYFAEKDGLPSELVEYCMRMAFSM